MPSAGANSEQGLSAIWGYRDMYGAVDWLDLSTTTGGLDEDHAVRQLIRRSRRSLAIALTGSDRFAESAFRHLARTPDRVTVQLLCTAEFASASADRLRRLPGRRTEVRISESELCGILVVDGAATLVPALDNMAGDPVAVISDPGAVHALELLFTGAWSSGRVFADQPQLSPRLRTELVQSILERLRDGQTDEDAAREINVSVRSYRRYVAEIMRELDADSRFQAGVRAVEYGLLPT